MCSWITLVPWCGEHQVRKIQPHVNKVIRLKKHRKYELLDNQLIVEWSDSETWGQHRCCSLSSCYPQCRSVFWGSPQLVALWRAGAWGHCILPLHTYHKVIRSVWNTVQLWKAANTSPMTQETLLVWLNVSWRKTFFFNVSPAVLFLLGKLWGAECFRVCQLRLWWHRLFPGWVFCS